MKGKEDSSYKEMSILVDSLKSEEVKGLGGKVNSADKPCENAKYTAAKIITGVLLQMPKIDKNKLWVKVMLDYGKKTKQVLKRDMYNQIIAELNIENYRI